MTPVDESSEVGRSTPTAGRHVRQASISSALAAVMIIALLVGATAMARPEPSGPPAGAVGVVPPPGPTEPPGSWIPILPSPEPTADASTSASPSLASSPSAAASSWRTGAPNTCNPYVKACDPTVMPVYPYVSILITTSGDTDADLGVGKVTVVAAGRTFSCSTYSKRGSCYFEVPPGTKVTATAAQQAGSRCDYLELMWEDHTYVVHDDCTPIAFTTRTQMAQLTANFTKVGPPTLAPPTEPPAATATPEPPTDPPATPAATPTPEPTALPT